MAIPVTQVKATILAFLDELKAAVHEGSCSHGVAFEYDEEFKISMSVIAPTGLNSLERTTIQTDGEKIQSVEQPEKLETQTTDEAVSTTLAGAGTSTTTTTRHEPEQRVTRSTNPKSSTTVKFSTPSVTTTSDEQSSSQDSSRTSGGGNRSTRDTEFENI